MQKDMGLTSTDFLNMFVAQLQNQDPTAPQDPSQMMSQLAQMTQVEQAYDTNTNLSSLITAQNNSSSMNGVIHHQHQRCIGKYGQDRHSRGPVFRQ
jgi:flagellar basal-body rod modification protein FlgD